ncbi:hypothetical protein AB1Y20_012580 [Prymnesium parvum]|uniref:RING-type E3 ubiquitin transferase n=1 Tax=Prymnesium parvum TaxID=97485 RepID=A0AB34IJT2_PRYPA
MLVPMEMEHAALRELSKWPTAGHDAPRPPPTPPPPPAPPDRARAKPKKRVNPTPTDHAPPQQTPPLAAFAAAADDEAPPPVATRLIARLDAAPARGAYCALLTDGAIPLLPSLKAALRCLLLPAPAAPPDETLRHVAPPHAAGEAIYLTTFAHACAYAALLLRGCGAALVAIDARLGATLATNARVAAAAGPPPLGAHVQQASAARLCSRAPLRAHTLPPSWLADPNETGKQFKTAAERGLWSNQQKMYDALLALQREYPCGQPPTLRGGVADFSAAVRERLGQMVSTPGEGGRADKLRAENMRWFAQFVTQRLVQSCLGHDVEPPSLSSNASVHGAVEVDHSKLHQLSRRMSVGSSSPLAASTTGRPSCGGGRGAWSKGPPGSGGDAERRGGARGKSWLGSYFPEGTVEHFWYKLLLALDSHCLFAHLIPLWMARLHQAAAGATPRGEGTPAARAEEPPPRGAAGDGGEPAEEEEQLLRCCVLARFLGFLLALPHCHMDVAGSPAFRAVLREAIAEHHSLAEHAMHRLASMVEMARLRGRLALCLPWLGCLLEMMRDDPIACHLAPYHSTMHSLQSLARACLPLSFPLADDHRRPHAATPGARAAVGLLVLLQTLLQGTPFFPLPDAQGEAAGGAEAGLSLGDEGARQALDRVLFEAKCVGMCCPELGEAQACVSCGRRRED